MSSRHVVLVIWAAAALGACATVGSRNENSISHLKDNMSSWDGEYSELKLEALKSGPAPSDGGVRFACFAGVDGVHLIFAQRADGHGYQLVRSLDWTDL